MGVWTETFKRTKLPPPFFICRGPESHHVARANEAVRDAQENVPAGLCLIGVTVCVFVQKVTMVHLQKFIILQFDLPLAQDTYMKLYVSFLSEINGFRTFRVPIAVLQI